MGKRKNKVKRAMEGAVVTAEVANEVTTDEVVVLDDAVEAAAGELETREVVEASYASQEAEVVAEGAAPTTEGEDAPKERKPRQPRMSLITHKASDIIRQVIGANTIVLSKDEALTSDDLEATLARIDSLDKKSREKAINLFSAYVAGKKPSVYTRQAIAALRASGTLSMKDLVATYQTVHGYKPGTAKRQASEMFALFPVVGIAKRESVRGAPLILNDQSAIVEKVIAA
jgi:hypothetical protein